MLVLTRKCQEVVVIGGADDYLPLLKVTVLGIENGKVRLGFEASDDVLIHRQEVWQRILELKKTANLAKVPVIKPDWASNLPND